MQAQGNRKKMYIFQCSLLNMKMSKMSSTCICELDLADKSGTTCLYLEYFDFQAAAFKYILSPSITIWSTVAASSPVARKHAQSDGVNF